MFFVININIICNLIHLVLYLGKVLTYLTNKIMYSLELSNLVEVSNNSKITNIVLETLNEKLSDEEKRDFEIWLRCVKVNIDKQIKSNK